MTKTTILFAIALSTVSSSAFAGGSSVNTPGTSCLEDADGDGHSSGYWVNSNDDDCDDAGETGNLGLELDCDDTNPDLFPTQTENVVNGIDDDCDGLVDELSAPSVYTAHYSSFSDQIDSAVATRSACDSWGKATREEFYFGSSEHTFADGSMNCTHVEFDNLEVTAAFDTLGINSEASTSQEFYARSGYVSVNDEMSDLYALFLTNSVTAPQALFANYTMSDYPKANDCNITHCTNDGYWIGYIHTDLHSWFDVPSSSLGTWTGSISWTGESMGSFNRGENVASDGSVGGYDADELVLLVADRLEDRYEMSATQALFTKVDMTGSPRYESADLDGYWYTGIRGTASLLIPDTAVEDWTDSVALELPEYLEWATCYVHVLDDRIEDSEAFGSLIGDIATGGLLKGYHMFGGVKPFYMSTGEERLINDDGDLRTNRSESATGFYFAYEAADQYDLEDVFNAASGGYTCAL